MNDDPKLPGEEKFSENSEENIRIENEFLQMKLSAETGAIFGGNANELPPEIMNEWLKNVAAFEKNYAEGKEQTVGEILGNPEFKDESLIDEEEFGNEYERLMEVLSDHGIDVGFSRDRDDRFKYRFITGELFDHSTTLAPVPGMVTCFSYEEFHPDHELEIEGKTKEFLNAFFERNISEVGSHLLAEEHILPEGRAIPREDLYKMFDAMYEAIPEFGNCSFQIEKIDFELKDDGGEVSGLGFSEGTVCYDLIFKDGKRRRVDGPFKIYFGMQWDWWTIYFFYLSGFNLHPKKDNDP